MTLQLIYISAATKAFKPEELKALLTAARKNNSKAGLTGILVYHGGSFLQVLEGPVDAVQGLLKKIEQDPRHGKITVLYKDTVEERSFEEWSMGFVDSSRAAEFLEGFVPYGSTLEQLTLDGSRAQRMLKRFRDGMWRQAA